MCFPIVACLTDHCIAINCVQLNKHHATGDTLVYYLLAIAIGSDHFVQEVEEEGH